MTAIRLLIAEPEKDVRDSLVFVLGAMDGACVVHAAATADDAERWLASHPGDWDIALVDEQLAGQLADSVSPGLRHGARPGPTDRAVLVLCDAAGGAKGCYDKRRDIDRIASLCMHLRNSSNAGPAATAGIGRPIPG